MHRFYVHPQSVGEKTICFDLVESHHIDKVLRLKPGDRVRAFDGQGNEFSCTLLQRSKQGWMAEIQAQKSGLSEPYYRIHLMQGLAKGDKMNMIIQKAVEIGVYSIIPLQSEYSVIRMNSEKVCKKVERWQTIAREACKQCGRSYIPAVHLPQTVDETIRIVTGNSWIMLYEDEYDMDLRTCIKEREILKSRDLYIMVGPEGGFSRREADLVRQHGACTAHLGQRILRTETAGLVAASILFYEAGDMATKEDVAW